MATVASAPAGGDCLATARFLMEAAIAAAVRSGASRGQMAAVTSSAMRVALTSDKASAEEDSCDADLQARQQLVSQSLVAHDSLNRLSGRVSHNLGSATQQAAPQLSGDEKRVLTKLRKRANRAKHTWCGGSASSGTPDAAFVPAAPRPVQEVSPNDVATPIPVYMASAGVGIHHQVSHGSFQQHTVEQNTADPVLALQKETTRGQNVQNITAQAMMQEEVAHCPKVFPQERSQQRIVVQISDVPIPHLQENTVHFPRTVEQIVVHLVPTPLQEMRQVPKIIAPQTTREAACHPPLCDPTGVSASTQCDFTQAGVSTRSDCADCSVPPSSMSSSCHQSLLPPVVPDDVRSSESEWDEQQEQARQQEIQQIKADIARLEGLQRTTRRSR